MNSKKLLQKIKQVRKNTIGISQRFETPYGQKRISYFDWTASGRLYKPIEEKILKTFAPFVGNTHSESTETGASMTIAYHKAKEIVKKHVNANKDYVLLMSGAGTTGAIARLQRLLGLKSIEQINRFNKKKRVYKKTNTTPIVFVTQMEHHSNQTTWLECDCEVILIKSNHDGIVDIDDLSNQLEAFKSRKLKIVSVSACSNVTGILNPVYDVAEVAHKHGALCFVDFAAAAPYIKIDVNPKNKNQRLDAIFFSPHKFLGGPGTPGVLIFNKNLYSKNLAPENPGGGTVKWTDPWEGRSYYDDIETREDGGTPAFLQTIKTALCIELKDQFLTPDILEYEKQLTQYFIDEINKISGLHILGNIKTKRLGIISFYIENTHYNLVVKLLNDRYGIQTRGGCSCAGTYGHILFGLNKENSKKIMDKIEAGDLSIKPGWVRVSLHPTQLQSEVSKLISALKDISLNYKSWQKDYIYSPTSNEFRHKKASLAKNTKRIEEWFNFK